MAEKKYIDHKKFNSKLNYIIRAYGLSDVISEKIKKATKESEAADVVEVVRCKDCIHREEHPDVDNTYYLTCNLKWGLSGTVAIEDYCSYGKRKELS